MRIQPDMNMHLTLKAIGFFLLEAIGIPGNFVILICFAHICIFHQKALPTEIILCKLSFVNLLVMLARVIPQSIAALGFRQLFSEQGCNLNVIVYRICKGMSVCLTSLQSCYQCAILARPSKLWNTIKHLVIQSLIPLMSSLWCFNSVLDVFTVNSFLWGVRENATANVVNVGFCFIRFSSYTVYLAYTATTVARDLACVVLMIFSSVHIVIILYRHNRQVKSIRRSEQDWKNGAETKAANVVLILVFMYVMFFGLDNCIWIVSIFTSSYLPTELIEARTFFASSYCALSPIVIAVTNKKIKMMLMSITFKTILKGQKFRVASFSKSGEGRLC